MNAQTGTSTSSESQKQFRCEVTANVTKSVRLSWVLTVESDPRDTMEARQVWWDVAHAQGELLRFLLAPATPIASPSTPS